jgi:hypothetical protein
LEGAAGGEDFEAADGAEGSDVVGGDADDEEDEVGADFAGEGNSC